MQSVERALRILEALAESPGEETLRHLARVTGLSPGTTHRLLRTLAARGYVLQTADRAYALGPRAIRLGEAANRTLAGWSRRYLADVVAATGETGNLAVLENDGAVYVAQAPSPHRLRIFAEVGRRVPLHSTAVGKVLLASLPDQEAERLIARTGLPARTSHTLTDPQALLTELRTVRSRGYAVDDEEEEDGVRCVAVPIRAGSDIVAAISTSAPSSRLLREEVEAVAGSLARIAERCGSDLFPGSVAPTDRP